MGARHMHNGLNAKAPAANKEKHHGNKRRLIQRLKRQASRAERAQAKQELLTLSKD